jgi:hypothetical protein
LRIVLDSSCVASAGVVPCCVSVETAPSTCCNETPAADATGMTVDRDLTYSSIVVFDSPAPVLSALMTCTDLSVPMW